MRYLWDTHALIWGLEADPQLPPSIATLAQVAGANAVSAISLWEVAVLEHKRRIQLSLPVSVWLKQVEARLFVLPITAEIAAKAYQLGEFQGDPADRIIAATSIVHGLAIISRDAKLRHHPQLTCLW